MVRERLFDHHDFPHAAPLCHAQNFLHPAKEAKHHRVIGTLRRERHHVCLKNLQIGDSFFHCHPVEIFQRLPGNVRRRHGLEPLRQSHGQKSEPAACVAHMSYRRERAADPIGELLLIGAEVRRVLHEGDHIVCPAKHHASSIPPGTGMQIVFRPNTVSISQRATGMP